MSLDKSIKSGKERRKQFRGSQSFNRPCRNHGSCGWCVSNRTHQFRRNHFAAQEQIQEVNMMYVDLSA